MEEKGLSWGVIRFKKNVFQEKINSNKSIEMERSDNDVHININESDGKKSISRFLIDRDEQLYMDPCLPDLPVVIKPAYELSILPGNKFETYIEIPMVMQISSGSSKKRQILTEIPTRSLSRSWFGDSESGEIAYFLESPMSDKIKNNVRGCYSIFCPVHIINKSSQILYFERMILRVPYLTIYRGRKVFYSGKTKITYRGQDQISQIVHQKTAPEVEDILHIYNAPRLAGEMNVLNKSFYFIKTLYNG